MFSLKKNCRSLIKNLLRLLMQRVILEKGPMVKNVISMTKKKKKRKKKANILENHLIINSKTFGIVDPEIILL